MAYMKTALFLVALCCLAQSKPSLSMLDVSSLSKALTVHQETSVKDSSQQEVFFLNVTLGVWGDFNKTSDNETVFNLVQDHLQSMQNQPKESALNLQSNYSLPLQYNLTVSEVILVGPSPQRTIAVSLGVQLYAKSRHHTEALSMLKAVKPTL